MTGINKDCLPDFSLLEETARRVRKETLKIHAVAPETRLASSLSAVELFVVLYYGSILRFDANNPSWEERDRLLISKGHGSISLYPILADVGYFPRAELKKVCSEGSFLGGIPDTMIPGYETINGSLGHGLGVACGMALALKKKKSESRVFVMLGDGELNEGAVWEGVMFAAQHRLDNLVAIVDNNKICMLDYCRKIIDLEPIGNKFSAFNWEVLTIDGHNLREVHSALSQMKVTSVGPRVLIADTVKGKGVPQLECDSLCHIKSLNQEEVKKAIEGLS
jgi:transketolase